MPRSWGSFIERRTAMCCEKHHVELNVQNGVGIVTLKRSAQLNAFNFEMLRELKRTLDEADKDVYVKVLLITGEGKAYTAGGDLEGLSKMNDPKEAELAVRETATMIKQLYEFRKPVIAAVNGAVFGAGVAFMLACDLVIASDKATVGFPFASIGFCPDCGTSYFLYKRVGHYKASEILFCAKTLSAQEALDYGLVNHVYPHEDFFREALKLAQQLSQGPEFALALTKKILRNAENASFEKHLEMESFGQILACQTEDFVEGIDALKNKRRPKFV
jgi:2-(1,2-epoxy-1,2-dihydrophenyl)acetyl-CoA isomerase